jgi:hypothetical protein
MHTDMETKFGEVEARGMDKALPRHISRHGSGYRVAVKRGKVLFRGYSRDLAEAVAMKRRFELAAGPGLYPETHASPSQARSNTGMVGITETLHWVQYRARQCLSVTWQSGPGKRRHKRVHFGPRSRSRSAAMRIAVKIRKAGMGGKSGNLTGGNRGNGGNAL